MTASAYSYELQLYIQLSILFIMDIQAISRGRQVGHNHLHYFIVWKLPYRFSYVLYIRDACIYAYHIASVHEFTKGT